MASSIGLDSVVKVEDASPTQHPDPLHAILWSHHQAPPEPAPYGTPRRPRRKVADRRLGGRPPTRSVAGDRHHVLHDVAPLDEKRASHRLGGRPGLATVRRARVQRLVDFLGRTGGFSVSFWTDSPIAVVAPSTLWASYAGRQGAGRRSRTPSRRLGRAGQLVGAGQGALASARHELLNGLGPSAHAVDDGLLTLADAVEHLGLDLLGGVLSVGMGRILLRRAAPLVHIIALTSKARVPGQTCRPVGSLHDGVHRPAGGGQPGPVGGHGRSPLCSAWPTAPSRTVPCRPGCSRTGSSWSRSGEWWPRSGPRPAVAPGRPARRPGPQPGAGGRGLHPDRGRARRRARGRALAGLSGLPPYSLPAPLTTAPWRALPPCTRPSVPTWTPGRPWPGAAQRLGLPCWIQNWSGQAFRALSAPSTGPGRARRDAIAGPDRPPGRAFARAARFELAFWEMCWSGHGRLSQHLFTSAAEPGAPTGPSHRPGDRHRQPGPGAVPVLAGPGLPVPAGLCAAVRPAAARAPDPDTWAVWSTSAHATFHQELSLHRGDGAEFGLGEADLDQAEVACVRGLYRLSAAYRRDRRLRRGPGRAAALHVGVFGAGRALAAAGLPAEPRYRRWIQTYADPAFAALAAWCAALLDRAADGLPAARLPPASAPS